MNQEIYNMIEWLFLILLWTYVGHYYLFQALAKNKKLFYGNSRGNNTKFSIIIPVKGKSRILIDKIKNTMQLSYPKKFVEIIIADDQNGSNKEIKKAFPKIKYVNGSKENLNNALNHALKVAKGKVIVKTDCNTFVPKNALKTVERILKSNPDVGAIAAIQNTIGNDLIKSYRNFMNQIHTNESLVYSSWIPGGFYAFYRNVINSFPETKLVPDDGYVALQCVKNNLRAVSTSLVRIKEMISSQGLQATLRFRRYTTQAIYTYFTHLPIIFKNKFFFLVSLRNLIHLIIIPLIIYYLLFYQTMIFSILSLLVFIVSLFSSKIRNLVTLFLIFIALWPLSIFFALFKIEKW